MEGDEDLLSGTSEESLDNDEFSTVEDINNENIAFVEDSEINSNVKIEAV